LLRLATLALRAKQYDQARELLQRFDREYPQSAFRVEYEQLLRRWQLENGKQ
jgi:TolA-binding protein